MGVTLSGTLTCVADVQAAHVRAALPDHIALTRAEADCLSFQVTQTADLRVWSVSEQFTDAAAFEAHQSRAAASDWARETAGIARDYKTDGL
jgi:quinol monooxygenase YgiN